MKTYVIKAAGGNPTAIKVINNKLTRADYSKFGSEFEAETKKHSDTEQSGFLIWKHKNQPHFEMTGGEFCGNAARSAAVVLFQLSKDRRNSFTMSGFPNVVESHVEQMSGNKYIASCEFSGLPTAINVVNTRHGEVSIVDLGGIVHIVTNAEFPADNYDVIHTDLVNELGYSERSSVGVLWIKETGSGVIMHPVVWVKNAGIDGLGQRYYETSCGSGTIAVSAVTHINEIIQPSGEIIKATISDSKVILESEMEIIFEEDEKVEYLIIDDVNNEKRKEVFALYNEAFGGEPYNEDPQSDEWLEDHLWAIHINHGCLIVALCKNKVVGLSAAIPIGLDKKAYDFLSTQNNLPFQLESTIYMSELAVSNLFRKSDMHIGSELVKKRIEWAKENGFKSYVMRTAAENSHSKNIYINTIGAKELTGAIQDVSENPDEVASASSQRIYLYGDVK